MTTMDAPIIQIELTHQSPTNIPFYLWHLIISYFPVKELKSAFITCKAFYSILMLNDHALLLRVKPYIVDLNEIEDHGFEWARFSFKYVPPLMEEGSYGKSPLPQHRQPCLDFIDSASKQRWQQVEYYNLLNEYKKWPERDRTRLKYQSLWKSLDTGAILYVFFISGNGFISLDNKENALVIGSCQYIGFVISMDFVRWTNENTAISLVPINSLEKKERKKKLKKPLSMEETKEYLGVIEVDQVFEHFKLLTKYYLTGEVDSGLQIKPYIIKPW